MPAGGLSQWVRCGQAGDELRGMGMMSGELVQLGISFPSQGFDSQLCGFRNSGSVGLH